MNDLLVVLVQSKIVDLKAFEIISCRISWLGLLFHLMFADQDMIITNTLHRLLSPIVIGL